MPRSVNFASPTEIEKTVAVLTDVQGTFHPSTRLFAAHRRAIVAAIDEAGITPGSPAGVVVAETLAVAAEYEADGMFAFMPNWDLLLSRVSRLDRHTGDDNV